MMGTLARGQDKAEAKRVIRELSTRAGCLPAYYTAAIGAQTEDVTSDMTCFEKADRERSEPMSDSAWGPWGVELRQRAAFEALLGRMGPPKHPPGHPATTEGCR